jgi:hypothetical protein
LPSEKDTATSILRFVGSVESFTHITNWRIACV